jgi:hypothetical protein
MLDFCEGVRQSSYFPKFSEAHRDPDTFGIVSLSDRLLDPSRIGSTDYVEPFNHTQFNPE